MSTGVLNFTILNLTLSDLCVVRENHTLEYRAQQNGWNLQFCAVKQLHGHRHRFPLRKEFELGRTPC